MADWLVVGAVAVVLLFVLASFVGRKRSRRSGRGTSGSASGAPPSKTTSTPLRSAAVLQGRGGAPARCSRQRGRLPVPHHRGAAAPIEDSNTPDPIDGLPTNAAAIIDDVINRYEQVCSQRDARPFSANVRTLVLPASEAKGPWAARAAIERELYGKERFYMTLDSHSRMVKSWDSKVLRMYTQCCAHHDKPILTTLPGSFLRGTKVADDDRPTFTAVERLNVNGFPVLKAIPFAEPPNRCAVAPFYTPAFSFASSNLVHEVPSDPECAFAHRAELYVQSARYWTHGWTFLQPKEAVCFHLADKAYRKTFEEQLELKQNQVLRQAGVCRALSVIQKDPCSVCGVVRDEHTPAHGLGHLFSTEFPGALTVHRDGYGLGKARTLRSFEEHCGVQVPHEATAHARIGCTKSPSVEERLAKFGRLEAYQLLVSEYSR